jgi:hypothetical protein
VYHARVLTESAARWLLVLHTAVGVAAVGAGTHLVIWLRRYVRGAAGLRRSVLRFAWLVLGLELSAFLIGNVMYPTYKVEVRAAYLENGAAVAADHAARDHDLARLADREHARPIEAPATAAIVRRAAQAARWFDVKEHWIALGMMCAAALVLILSLWQPSRDGPVLAPVALGLAVIVAATSWLGAIIGVMTAAWRAV